jgi:ABC-type glycerol-3-phosphate transport system permease component
VNRRTFFRGMGRYGGYLLLALVVLLPLSWVVLSSFKHPSEIFTYPPSIFPRRFVISNYIDVLRRTEMGLYLFNTVVVAVLSMALTLVIAAPAAYGFSYYNFKMKYPLLIAMLGLQLIPGSVNIIPYYIMMAKLGLLNRLSGLILIFAAIRVPFAIWILKAHFDTLPASLAESARLDGCSNPRILWSIIIPLSLPGLGAAGFLTLLFSWGQFLLPLVVASSRETMLVAVGLYSFFGTEGAVSYHYLFAASVITSVPLVIGYLLTQKSFISGLTQGAVK